MPPLKKKIEHEHFKRQEISKITFIWDPWQKNETILKKKRLYHKVSSKTGKSTEIQLLLWYTSGPIGAGVGATEIIKPSEMFQTKKL